MDGHCYHEPRAASRRHVGANPRIRNRSVAMRFISVRSHVRLSARWFARRATHARLGLGRSAQS